jgi:hypothetical protein
MLLQPRNVLSSNVRTCKSNLASSLVPQARIRRSCVTMAAASPAIVYVGGGNSAGYAAREWVLNGKTGSLTILSDEGGIRSNKGEGSWSEAGSPCPLRIKTDSWPPHQQAQLVPAVYGCGRA